MPLSCPLCQLPKLPGYHLSWSDYYDVLGFLAAFAGERSALRPSLFCGWGCPGGLLNQMIGKIVPFKLRVRNTFTALAPFGKYLGLAGALCCVDVPIRIGEFFQSVLLTFEHASLPWLVRTFFVLGFLGLGLLVANAWCRFACPAGGLLERVRNLALFRFYKTSKCNDCNQCLDVCPMGTRPNEANCTNCGDCREACPSDAIVFGRRK